MQCFTYQRLMRVVCNWLLFYSFMLLDITVQAALNDTSYPQLKAAEQWSSTVSMTTERAMII